MGVVKKTVAIHPVMDKFIRKTWAMLIEMGYDATYSTALNYLLLGAILEASKKGGWSEETRNIVWAFLEDEKTLKEINLEDQIANILNNIATEAQKALLEVKKDVKR